MKELSERIGNHQFAKIGATCKDCEKDFTIDLERTGPDQIEIKAGAIGKRNGEYLFKCPECLAFNPNFGPRIEIYSRVVGYLRPVGNWHGAKQTEFGMRKVYQSS